MTVKLFQMIEQGIGSAPRVKPRADYVAVIADSTRRILGVRITLAHLNVQRQKPRKKRVSKDMKKIIYMITFILMVGLCAGCGKEEIDSTSRKSEETDSTIRESEETDSTSRESIDIEFDDKLQMDYTHDYSENIKADVDYLVSGSESLQKELEDIERIIQKYTPLAEAAQTQGEMNVSSRWFFVIWDTELNNLWSRFSDSADRQTKEKILAEQRNWIAMKEEVTLLSIGSREENGSMYPLLENSFLEEITKNRAYILASELAKIRGEAFTMPERSAKYGLFVDNQGTGNVYSSLTTCQGWEGDDEAIISIYRQGETEGTFVDNGNGELIFTSNDGSVKGIIKISGWDGASFKVTETSGESAFSVGEEVKFPFVF